MKYFKNKTPGKYIPDIPEVRLMKGNIIIMKPMAKLILSSFSRYLSTKKNRRKRQRKKGLYFNIKRKFHKTCSEKQGYPLWFTLFLLLLCKIHVSI
ncbi:hypothetical protein [Candidatus Kuenenia stuttgartiensis]|uniref:hypothetical protein n=1 Tax=Kuenenia stuttgartiensis TaxID=174633 RepID=UPI00146A3D5E|nr:hypothetical protein [Candidatus Kuenenia stuttgartiensis]